MVVITDILTEPFDEGGKIATLALLRALKEMHGVTVFSINSEYRDQCIDKRMSVNRAFLAFKFLNMVRRSKGWILYIPQGSATFFSFLRSWFLRLFTGRPVFILSFQQRSYSFVQRFIIKRICSRVHVLTQSLGTVSYLKDVGVDATRLPLGIDYMKFKDVDQGKRLNLREKYSIDRGAKVVLHVGHVAASRNLNWLIEIKHAFPEVVVVMIASTSTSFDEKIGRDLKECGVYLVNGYLENIEEIYNIADVYLFPVLSSLGAIETPLSVLEAMACNLRVISTRFGSLPELFTEDYSFKFVASAEEVIECLRQPSVGYCNNREKVKRFSWSSIADELAETVEGRA